MKILVLGGSGFLGFHLVKFLEKKNHKVTVFDKSKGHFKNENRKIILGNINNYKKLSKAIKGQDVVYNFAAISDIGDSIKKPIETAENNILGNLYILDLCVKYQIKKFIFASTIYVHSNQGSFYRVSKQSSELFIAEYKKRFGLDYSIIRCGSIFGPKSSKRNGLSKIINKAIKNKKIYYSGTKNAVRSFLYVKDAAHASAEILKKKYNGKNLLITGSSKIKITKVLKKISKIMKLNKKPVFGNKKNEGHYDVNPYSYVPLKDKKIKIKNSITLDEGINELIMELKK